MNKYKILLNPVFIFFSYYICIAYIVREIYINYQIEIPFRSMLLVLAIICFLLTLSQYPSVKDLIEHKEQEILFRKKYPIKKRKKSLKEKIIDGMLFYEDN